MHKLNNNKKIQIKIKLNLKYLSQMLMWKIAINL